MNVSKIDAEALRAPEADGGHAWFRRRWSPRAMSGQPLDQATLETLLEAARWAPSSYNAQPWLFLYAHRGTPEWPLFFDTLVDFNQAWARHAGVLIAVLSRRTTEDDKPSPTHSFDAGAAWMSLALQASELGLVSHGMAGFDRDAARTALEVPEQFAIEAMVAVGHPGPVDVLPEKYRERETPSQRKPLDEIAAAGRFPAARG